ncbi:hypothetical protein T484DRAFT_1816611, partial [Baffinella frigidus]
VCEALLAEGGASGASSGECSGDGASGEVWSEQALRHAAFVLATLFAQETRDAEDGAAQELNLAKFRQARKHEAPAATAARLWARCAAAAFATQLVAQRKKEGGKVVLPRLKAIVGALAPLLEQVATQDELRGVISAAGEPLLLLLRATLREAKPAQEGKPGQEGEDNGVPRLHHRGPGGVADQAEAVWAAAALAIARCAPHQVAEGSTLAALAPAFALALRTTNVAITNKAVEVWNSTFGRCVLKLDYPADLRAALAKLSNKHPNP